MKVDRLEREMQRFGPIKQNGVELRRNVVGTYARGAKERSIIF